MEKILRQLYNSEIPMLESSYPTDPGYLELRDQFDEKNDLLTGMLNDQGRMLLEEIISLCMQMDSSLDADKFSDGFKLGARIILEILEDDKQPIYLRPPPR
ncbi:MAG: hypothetical protein FWE77_00165 [Clostridia bacterium]|nr:hypothetical protein [Clostridia bacterium]